MDEIVDAAGFRGSQDRFAVAISNMPTGDLTYLDAGYSFTLTNIGNAGGAARGNGKS